MNGDPAKSVAGATPYGLVTYLSKGGEERVGLLLDGWVVEIARALAFWGTATGRDVGSRAAVPSMLALLESWETYEPLLTAAAAFSAHDPEAVPGSFGLADVRLLAPVPRPGKVLDVGLNYYEHAEEMGMTIPEGAAPNVFYKGAADAVIGPSQAIRLTSTKVDWEAELALVIGRTACAVSVDRALDYVAGYTCHNDVTDRLALVRADGGTDFLAGKARDTYAALGPALVPRRFVPRPDDLRVCCRVNGDVVQDYSTSGMYWDVARCVAYVSSLTTLRPGDVLGLGTGAGTGWAHGAPEPRSLAGVVAHMKSGGGRYLGSGDRVAVEIEGVGILENEVA